jgi:hypothetical protein
MGLAHSFLVSVFLLGISVWIRLRLNESRCSEDEGRGKKPKAPLTEAFANWSNAKIMLLALIGGWARAWSGTPGFYTLFFCNRS